MKPKLFALVPTYANFTKKKIELHSASIIVIATNSRNDRGIQLTILQQH